MVLFQFETFRVYELYLVLFKLSTSFCLFYSVHFGTEMETHRQKLFFRYFVGNVGCCMCMLYTLHNFMKNVCVQREFEKEKIAEKGLLTTLSSCCNSMRAGMQEKERNGEESRRDRDRETVSGISRSWWGCHTFQQHRIGWNCIKTLSNSS